MLQWKRADLHLHTSFSGWRSLRLIDARDCYVSPAAAFETARSRGMDFVCFTDHNTINGALDFLARHPEEESRVIIAEEVETRFPDSHEWLHINVFGMDERIHEDLARARFNCFELIAELRARGLFFALNHPFQSFRSLASARCHLEAVLPQFPAVEVCNSTSPRSVERLLQALLTREGSDSAAWVGGSDAHTLPRIASVYTTAPGASKVEFLENVRRGTCAVRGRPQGLWALVRDVYLVVGEYYARLYGTPLPLSRRRLQNILLSFALLPAVIMGVPALLTVLHAARQEWIARCGLTSYACPRNLGEVRP